MSHKELFPEITHWWLSNSTTFLQLRFLTETADLFCVCCLIWPVTIGKAFGIDEKQMIHKLPWLALESSNPHCHGSWVSWTHTCHQGSVWLIMFIEWGAETNHLWGLEPPFIWHGVLYSCYSVKSIHNDGRLGGPLWLAAVFPARVFAFLSWSNKTNVSFHMKRGTKKRSV